MDIYKQIETSLKKSLKSPQIILDIDDTLIDCRHRKHRVFSDFLLLKDISAKFPTECEKLRTLSWKNVRYKVYENLNLVQIDNHEFADRLVSFWREHYFTYPYLINDQPFPGAVRFATHCHQLGIRITYLTGRDIPGMWHGTQDSLKKLGFPTEGESVHFILKEDPSFPDFEFKKDALENIGRDGHVIAALENELPNLNEMAERFPDGLMFWRKTLYAPDPPTPHPRVQILDNFPE